MAKLIFEKAEIYDNAEPPALQGIIRNIVVEGLEKSLEPDTVNVEDNREIYESYTGRIVVRTKNTDFEAGQDLTGDILDSTYVSTDGTLPTEGRLKLVGKSGSHSLMTGITYIQGHRAFDNDRLETVLVAQSSDVDSTTAMDVSEVS